MKHGEPSHEYDTEQKREYREAVWSAFAQSVPVVATAKVLFFPGRHGFEIPVALRYGFKAENLIACEENAALLATAKWRKDYPTIRCYGTELQRTAKRLAQEGVTLDAANLDFCSNLSQGIFGGIDALIQRGPIAPSFALAITVLKGREDPTLVSSIRALTGADGPIDRIKVLRAYITQVLSQCTWGVTKGEYRSGAQNMSFAVWVVRPLSWLIGLYADWVQKHMADIDKVLRARKDMEFYYDRTRPGYSYDKGDNAEFDMVDTAQKLRVEFDAFREPLQAWCAEMDEQKNVPGWGLLLEAFGYLFAWERSPLVEVLSKAKDEMRERWMRSEAEKSQLLQAGRAYN